jgi:hypothetical protein
VERAGQGQGVRKGPVTGPLDRPSQQTLETRKAADHIRPRRDAVRFARKTVASIHTAELEILSAAQKAARQQTVAATDAMLSDRHASAIALVIAKFAGRRAALATTVEPGARAAAAQQLVSEETAELARLALEHAAEKRAQRKAVTAPLLARQRAERRALRHRLRRQRAVVAVLVGAARPATGSTRAASPRSGMRSPIGNPWRIKGMRT